MVVLIANGDFISYSLCKSVYICIVQLPSQMAAVLESNLLCHVLCSGSDPLAMIRLTYWLQHYLGYGTYVCVVDTIIMASSES